MAAVAQHKSIDMGTYMGIKVVKHLNIAESGIIERKFFVASDEKTDWMSAADTFNDIKEKIDEHLRECEQVKKLGSVTKYVLYRTVAETQNKEDLQEGFGFRWHTDLEAVDTFDNLKDATKALKSFKTSVEKIKGRDVIGYRMTEYVVIEELHGKWTDRKEVVKIWAYSKNNFKKMEVK